MLRAWTLSVWTFQRKLSGEVLLLLSYIQWFRVRTAAVVQSHGAMAGDFTAHKVLQQMFDSDVVKTFHNLVNRT